MSCWSVFGASCKCCSKRHNVEQLLATGTLGSSAPSGKGKKQEEDTFGMNDEDWSVYREIVS